MFALIGGYSLEHLLKVVIIIAALIAIAVVAVKGMGLQIPPWAVQIFWIVVIAIVAIFSLGLISGL